MPGGTRFRLFPQYAEGYREPEVVEMAFAPGVIGPGPQDGRMYVANAVDKPRPYQVPDQLPPYAGPLYPPAMPGSDGHFDRIPVGTPQFLAAHIYGITRRVLDWTRDRRPEAGIYLRLTHGGRYTPFHSPTLFVVKGQGDDVRSGNDDVDPARLGLAHLNGTITFASDLKYWTYDSSYQTMRLDMSSGTLQQLVIDSEAGGAHGRRIDLVGQEGSFSARVG
jgi:hypothetical protein